MSYPILGSALKSERTSAEVSQEEVARVMGVSVKTVQRLEQAETVKPGHAVAFRSAVDALVRARSERRRPDNVVPRGTSTEAHSASVVSGRGTLRLRRADAFEREMVRLGANDFEADHVRTRARNFLESVLSHGGTPDLTEDDLDQEFEVYLQSSLRPWVIDQMKKRGEDPGPGDSGSGGGHRGPRKSR